MATELKVPALLMDMEEATIVRWLVEEGAEVKRGEPILEIDTDKTSFELEAPADGIIHKVRGEEGETLQVGTTLAYIAAPGEEMPASARPSSLEAAAQRGKEQRKPDDPGGGDIPARQQPPEEETSRDSRNGRRQLLRASPAARRAAAERKLRLEEIRGSGPLGRIYLSDVLKAERSLQSTPAPAAQAPTHLRQPLSRIRRLGAERTARSFREVPHFYLTRELEADRLAELQGRLKKKMEPPPSITDLLALAVSRTLRDHPRLNSRYANGELEPNQQINLGIAVATEEGLVVPVLKEADRLPLKELVSKTRDLVSRAREGRLHPQELSGGTFTISNLGMLGIDHFEAIINAPQAAILAFGRLRTVPEWKNGEWVPKRVLSGTLSVDHRVADGADGARFLEDLQAAIADWELLL